jgi:4'-phosphopantetheinyl transferase
MNKLNAIVGTGPNPEAFMMESEQSSIPDLNHPVLIILKTECFSKEDIAGFGSLLSENETAKSLRFKFTNDSISYILVHGYLRWMLGRHFNIDPKSVVIDYNSYGRPFVSGCSGQVYFNLSHSKGLSVLAFDPDNEIGVDVEKMDMEFEYQPIVQHFFTKNEERYIENSNGKSRQHFYELWTRKEAFLKALGIGITENLGVEVLKESIPERVIKDDGSMGKGYLFKTMMYEEDFMITVALNLNSTPVLAFDPCRNEINFHKNTYD